MACLLVVLPSSSSVLFFSFFFTIGLLIRLCLPTFSCFLRPFFFSPATGSCDVDQSSIRNIIMVSQTVLEHSAPAPSAASVSSRHSHLSHRHRASRSLHGGSSLRTQNDFPIFSQTGDVEIVIRSNGQERRYLLHRLILAQCSGFFEASTSEDWSRAKLPDIGRPSFRLPEDDSFSVGSTLVQSESGAPQKMLLHYELDWENRADDEEPILVQKVGVKAKVCFRMYESS